MKIKWLGHASFLITSEEGTRILLDPYTPGGPLSYADIAEEADIVTVSHGHGDHNNVAAVRGKPQVVRGSGSHQAKGIEFQGLATYHDTASGRERGENVIFCFSVDGIRVCHLGDLGHPLSEGQIAQIGPVDVLCVPVGGFFTIDARTASGLCQRIAPGVVIPMHYKTAKCDYPLAGVEDFLKGKAEVRGMEGSEVELQKGQLPEKTEIVVLQHAL